MVAIPEGQISPMLSSLSLGALGTTLAWGVQGVSVLARRSEQESQLCDHEVM